MQTLLIAGLSYLVLLNGSVNMQKLRSLYEKASLEEASCKEVIRLTEKSTPEKDPVNYCYLGAAQTISAQYAGNPYTKLQLFNSGKSKIEHAANLQPKNVEIAYLRFTVQCGAPAFLNYSSAMTNDKTVILDNLENVFRVQKDFDLFYRIVRFLEKNKNVTPTEKQRLQQIKTNLNVK
ncbi:MAG: hypothetical protein LW750_03885 [Bacteroidetes bacterium]|nr:hypothetical protein [Bacteroidota bacterium]